MDEIEKLKNFIKWNAPSERTELEMLKIVNELEKTIIKRGVKRVNRCPQVRQRLIKGGTK